MLTPKDIQSGRAQFVLSGGPKVWILKNGHLYFLSFEPNGTGKILPIQYDGNGKWILVNGQRKTEVTLSKVPDEKKK